MLTCRTFPPRVAAAGRIVPAPRTTALALRGERWGWCRRCRRWVYGFVPEDICISCWEAHKTALTQGLAEASAVRAAAEEYSVWQKSLRPVRAQVKRYGFKIIPKKKKRPW